MSGLKIMKGEIEIGLDRGCGDYTFISHAHADHLEKVKNIKKLVSSRETALLAGLPNETETPEGVALYDAGHMVGARQLRAEADGGTITYTGDYRLKKGIFDSGAEIVETDHLMIEATYGDPAFRFPEPFDVYEDLAAWMKEKTKSSNVLIGAYRMGKSQEIIRILNEYLGIVPVVGSSIFKVVETYNRLGYRLDALEIGSDEAQESLDSGFVAMLPPKGANRGFARALAAAHGRPCLSVAATGWSIRYGMNVDKSFPLSDHSDYYDAVRYMEESGAKKVTFFDGDPAYLAKAAMSLGISVANQTNQPNLSANVVL
jgi:hypothetical protein